MTIDPEKASDAEFLAYADGLSHRLVRITSEHGRSGGHLGDR